MERWLKGLHPIPKSSVFSQYSQAISMGFSRYCLTDVSTEAQKSEQQDTQTLGAIYLIKNANKTLYIAFNS